MSSTHSDGSHARATMNISQFAQAAGVSTDTVRYYEKQGLISAPRRQANRYRSYTDADVAAVRFVRGAQALGFSLSEIRAILPQVAKGSFGRAEIEQQLQAKMAQIEAETQSKIRIKEAESMFSVQTMQQEAQIKLQLMQQEFQMNMQLKGIDASMINDKEKMKEEAKDKRISIQNTQQSKLIEQRKNNLPPVDFESNEDTLDGFSLASFEPK